ASRRRLALVQRLRAAYPLDPKAPLRNAILDCVPVLPPDLRLLAREGATPRFSDINDLYRALINRNNRLKKLVELNAPEIIIRNERGMPELAVGALFDNRRLRRPVRGEPGNRLLWSLGDRLRSADNRLRRDVLAKPVDYSGRGVLVPDPDVPPGRCAL